MVAEDEAWVFVVRVEDIIHEAFAMESRTMGEAGKMLGNRAREIVGSSLSVRLSHTRRPKDGFASSEECKMPAMQLGRARVQHPGNRKGAKQPMGWDDRRR